MKDLFLKLINKTPTCSSYSNYQCMVKETTMDISNIFYIKKDFIMTTKHKHTGHK